MSPVELGSQDVLAKVPYRGTRQFIGITAGHDRTRQDTTGHDRARQGTTGHDRTRQDTTQSRHDHDTTTQNTTTQPITPTTYS